MHRYRQHVDVTFSVSEIYIGGESLRFVVGVYQRKSFQPTEMSYQRGRNLGHRHANHITDGGSLVKRIDNAARTPLYLTNQNGRFSISQSQLKSLWPGAMDLARQQGNQTLYANDLINRPYRSIEERDSCNLAIDFLRSCSVSMSAPTSHGLLHMSIFDGLAKNALDSYRRNDATLLQKDLKNLMDFFLCLTRLFDPEHGIGRAVYNEVIDMGLCAAPLIAIIPPSMYELTHRMWTMTSYDSDIIVRMVKAIPPPDQKDLGEVAKAVIAAGGDATFAPKVVAAVFY